MIEIGKRYRIKKHLGDVYHENGDVDPGYNPEMRKYLGTVVTVSKQCSRPYWYKVLENGWTWDEEWLVPLEPEKEYEIVEEDIMNLFE